MPRYYFVLRLFDREDEDEHAAELHDLAAALDYACCMVRELGARGHCDPGLVVTVRNEARDIVLSVPWLPAYA